jgi:hypothetical protein
MKKNFIALNNIGLTISLGATSLIQSCLIELSSELSAKRNLNYEVDIQNAYLKELLAKAESINQKPEIIKKKSEDESATDYKTLSPAKLALPHSLADSGSAKAGSTEIEDEVKRLSQEFKTNNEALVKSLDDVKELLINNSVSDPKDLNEAIKSVKEIFNERQSIVQKMQE